ncbi:hypothetical protein H5410_031432 [Solanum commersonii]|uniref:Uncharacterized protein n=1 Tax=Solanum commersonii TaxID=4109 RepID=A0A9J5YMB7_SOLCO|nr:hypothetical protein H5410_031432 [Solanum commersonii]
MENNTEKKLTTAKILVRIREVIYGRQEISSHEVQKVEEGNKIYEQSKKTYRKGMWFQVILGYGIEILDTQFYLVVRVLISGINKVAICAADDLSRDDKIDTSNFKSIKYNQK